MPQDPTKIFTPVELEILLHYYYSCNVWPNYMSQAYINAVSKLMKLEMLEPSPDNPHEILKEEWVYDITSRGAAYVKMLCCTPPPDATTAWIDSRTNTIYGYD